MAANKCSASQMAGPAMPQGSSDLSLASAEAHLAVCASGVSVEPSEYNWGTPSPLQQSQLYSQFLSLAFMCSGALPMPSYGPMPMPMPGRYFTPQSPFSGYMPASSPSPSPSPVPSPPASQQTSGSGKGSGPGDIHATLAGAQSRKAGAQSKKAGTKPKCTKAGAMPEPAGAGAGSADELECELEDICKLLGDDAFLEHLQDDVLSEGSNGSSASPDCRALPKAASHGSLCANDSGAYPRNSFATAFDMDLDDVPAAAAAAPNAWAPGAAPAQPGSALKANSADLNNLVAAASPTRPIRSSRLAAREVAAAAKESGSGAAAAAVAAAPAPAAAAAAPARLTLKVKGGGVQKVAAAKASKGQQQHVASATAAAAVAAVAAAPAAQGAAAEEQLTAADLSRLLGEDDNRIPDGWDLDLDFENPFSCSISAF